MQLILRPPTAIIIAHHGQQLEFSIAGTNSYQSTQLVNIVQDDQGKPYDPFKDLNDYILTLDKKLRDDLFHIYEGVADQFTEILSLEELKAYLTDAFKGIYDIVKIEDINKWMSENDRVKIPTTIEDNVSSHYQEERTYTPEKYKGLISLSVGLKLALPIWGAVVRYITKGTGVGRKEIHCAHLLKKSTLIYSPQYDDFVNFVVSTYEVGKAKTDSVLTGVGTEEQITLLPSACLVRKIAVSPNLKSRSAVTEAYNYVVNQGPGHERKHPQIKAKLVEKGVPVEEQSLLETYKVKESVFALMVTSRAVDLDVDTSIGNSRRQIPADIDAKLDELYPIRISGMKEPLNMVKDAISQYFNSYSGRTYRSIYTTWFNPMVEDYVDRDGNHYLKPETPITLAKIVIDIYGEK